MVVKLEASTGTGIGTLFQRLLDLWQRDSQIRSCRDGRIHIILLFRGDAVPGRAAPHGVTLCHQGLRASMT